MADHAKPNLLYLFKGSALYGAADVFSALVRFGLVALYTRILAPGDFGLYAVISATLLLACIALPLGLPNAVMIRFKSDDLQEQKTLKTSSYSLMFLLCAVSAIVFFGVMRVFPQHGIVSAMAPWLIVQGCSEMLSMVPKASLRFNQKVALFSAARVLRIIIMVAALLTLLAMGGTGLAAVIIAEAIAALAEFLLCCIFDGFVPLPVFRGGVMPLVRLGVPLTAVAFGIFLNDLSDRYVVFSFLGEQANGYYAAAAKIAVLGSLFAEAFNAMWFPYYFRVAQRNGSTPEEMRAFSSKLVVLFAMLVSLCVIVLPQFVTLRVFGRYFIDPKYHGVAVLVAPLTLVYFFKMCMYISSPLVAYNKKIWNLSAIVWVAAVLNITANIVVTQTLGRAGMFVTLTVIAFVSSVSYGLGMVWVAKQAGLFPVRWWFASPQALASAGLLCLAFVPVFFPVRLTFWAVAAFFLYRKFFANSNFFSRFLSGKDI
jgi:O-antigen/teichoic acid export membrane protein